MKLLWIFLLTGAIAGFTFYESQQRDADEPETVYVQAGTSEDDDDDPSGTTGVSSITVDSVVARAQRFKALLTATQISALQKTYTAALARNWTNLPVNSTNRNGIRFDALTDAQLAAAKLVIQAAAGTTVNEGYDEFLQELASDSLLGTRASGYGKGFYLISFLNEPSTTGAWMLQYGGHHYAANIAFNGGAVVGVTPLFVGIEPRGFTQSNGIVVAPLEQENARFSMLLASLTSTQLASAKVTTTFSDVFMGPSNNTFSTTRIGLIATGFTTIQLANLDSAISKYVGDLEDVSRDSLMAIYRAGLTSTYVAYAGNTTGVSGDTSTWFNSNADYIRIDGPRVWIEFVCQNGIVLTGIHFHSIYRDRVRDYGNDLVATSLPLDLLSFTANVQGKKKVISWATANEQNVSHFEIERSAINANGSYISIGNINAKNSGSNTYTFDDNNALTENVYYYRLKVVDKDGVVRYSRIVSVKNNSIKTVIISPNPATNLLTISLSEALKSGTLAITNSAGKMVLRSNNRTGSKLDMDISALAAGVYFIQIEDNGAITAARFVKQTN